MNKYFSNQVIRKILFPKIDRRDWLVMFGYAFLGALVAGSYGIIHDQFTFSIGREYFTKLKFHQFEYADFGLGDRYFVGCIGFLATWWVGAFSAWFLARIHIPRNDRVVARRRILRGFGVTLFFGVIGTMLGFLYGIWRGPDGDYSAWQPMLAKLRVVDSWGFMRVAYIHNSSYLGGFMGFLAAMVTGIRSREKR